MPLPSDIAAAWQEAASQERRERAAAFVGGPVAEHEYCGYRLPPLRLRHLAVMETSGIALGGTNDPAHDSLRLWLIWNDAVAPFGGFWKRRRLAQQFKRHRGIIEDLLARGMKLEFADAPTGSSGKDRVAVASMTAVIVDILASEYGWTIEYCMDLPLRQVWQLLRAMQRRHDADAPIGNPSDSVITQWLNHVSGLPAGQTRN